MALYPDTHPIVARRGVSRGGVAAWLLESARAWQIRARQRREATGLSARDLADIGLTRDQVQAELAKPFWRR
jgi:uncharacterized protein YjiS (DUF1127 family)